MGRNGWQFIEHAGQTKWTKFSYGVISPDNTVPLRAAGIGGDVKIAARVGCHVIVRISAIVPTGKVVNVGVRPTAVGIGQLVAKTAAVGEVLPSRGS